MIILINNNIDLINHILLNHFFLFFIDFDLTNISIIIILSKNLIILYSDINKFFIFNQKNVFDNLYFIFINVKNSSSKSKIIITTFLKSILCLLITGLFFFPNSSIILIFESKSCFLHLALSKLL